MDTITHNTPADLRTVTVDTAAPVEERMRQLAAQLGDPHRFRVGDITVKVTFTGERPFAEAAANVIAR